MFERQDRLLAPLPLPFPYMGSSAIKPKSFSVCKSNFDHQWQKV